MKNPAESRKYFPCFLSSEDCRSHAQKPLAPTERNELCSVDNAFRRNCREIGIHSAMGCGCSSSYWGSRSWHRKCIAEVSPRLPPSSCWEESACKDLRPHALHSWCSTHNLLPMQYRRQHRNLPGPRVFLQSTTPHFKILPGLIVGTYFPTACCDSLSRAVPA